MGVIIPKLLQPIISKMVTDAKAAGVNLSAGSGLRTYDEQLAIRKNYVIDKSKVNDLNYLKTAPSNAFYPLAAAPGTSNHESGLAIDFNTTGNPKAYAWLKANAAKYGFIRTIPSENWHWEYRPTIKLVDGTGKNLITGQIFNT